MMILGSNKHMNRFKAYFVVYSSHVFLTPRFMKRLILFCAALCAFGSPIHAQPFTYQFINHQMPIIQNGTLATGDMNNDGRMDYVTTGFWSNIPDGTIFRNQGVQVTVDLSGVTITQLLQDLRPGSDMPKMVFGTIALGDVDNDGDLDFAASGATNTQAPYTTTAGIFTNLLTSGIRKLGTYIDPLYSGDLAFGDFDNDGRLDLAQCGASAEGVYSTKIFRNDWPTFPTGAPTFKDIGAGLIGVAFCDVAWNDIDNDGDLDLTVSGATTTSSHTRVYRNTDGRFTDMGFNLVPLVFSSLDWGDFDHDGDDDLVISGGKYGPGLLTGVTKLYRNDAGSLTEMAVNFPGAFSGKTAWTDFDNDGDLDVLLIGGDTAITNPRARVMQNLGGGNFRPAVNLIGAMLAAVGIGDIDGDADSDVMIQGYNGVTGAASYFRNDTPNLNLLPTAPKNLKTEVSGNTVTLSWDASLDLLTPEKGLMYNARIGTTTGGQQILSAMANLTTGLRRLTAHGNAGHRRSLTIRGLKNGIYYWSVQAMDSGFAGSAFAEETTFSITGAQNEGSVEVQEETLPTEIFQITSSYPNPFDNHTTLELTVPAPGKLQVRVLDLLGKQVRLLTDTTVASGKLQLGWDAADATGRRLPAGMYLVEARYGDQQTVQKVMVR